LNYNFFSNEKVKLLVDYFLRWKTV